MFDTQPVYWVSEECDDLGLWSYLSDLMSQDVTWFVQSAVVWIHRPRLLVTQIRRTPVYCNTKQEMSLKKTTSEKIKQGGIMQVLYEWVFYKKNYPEVTLINMTE